VITATHYNRADYTAASLAALAKCEGIGDCLYVARVEHSCDAVIAAVRAIDFCEVDLVINPQRLGCNANTIAAIEAGFDRSEFVIHVEDDVLLAPDALAYFWWARAAYCGDPRVATVAAYNRDKQSPHPALHHHVHRRVWFHPWGWGTWRDRWRNTLADAAVGVGSGRLTWDTALGHRVVDAKLSEVYPVLSRSQNIGVRSSIHPPGGFFTPAWHREHQHCPHWAGDGRPVNAGSFQEVPPA
jgi:hypothetical protein